jgi:type IV secretory pathway VirB6-like protein
MVEGESEVRERKLKEKVTFIILCIFICSVIYWVVNRGEREKNSLIAYRKTHKIEKFIL